MSNVNGISERVGNSLVTVGPFTYGSEKLAIWQWNEGASLTIGRFCSIAPAVTIMLGGIHRIDWSTTFPFGHVFLDELCNTDIVGHPATNGDVVIGNDVWIGYGSTIMSGVTIGSGAVIAAHSNVTKDVAPYEIVGGNPARHIRYRFGQDIIDLLLQLRWWDLPLGLVKEIARDLSCPPSVEHLSGLIGRVSMQMSMPG